jgi:hypothetical protein
LGEKYADNRFSAEHTVYVDIIDDYTAKGKVIAADEIAVIAFQDESYEAFYMFCRYVSS